MGSIPTACANLKINEVQMAFLHNLSAVVAQQNTPETDAMAKIDHTVTWTENGVHKSKTVLAADPMEAIAVVRRLFAELDD